MAPKWHYSALAVIILLSALVVLRSEDGASAPNSVQLVCDIESVTTVLTNNNITIPVYLTNITDSVQGFELWVNIAEPNFIKFVVQSAYWDTFTTCVGYNQAHECTLSYKDSNWIQIPKVDRVGTRSQNWEVFTARILDTAASVIKVIGIADNGAPPITKPIAPGSGTLLKLFAQTNGTLGDSLCDTVVVKTRINKSESRFSNQLGKIIGCNYELVIDTFYFNCLTYVGDSCVEWGSIVYDSIWHCVIDTTRRVLLDGEIGFDCNACTTCGDANGDGFISITDAVALIGYVFNGVPIPGDCNYPFGLGDANGDGFVSITDAVTLIGYVFSGSPIPHCQGQLQ